MNIEQGFEYYKTVCAWDMPERHKMKVLSQILEACYSNHWRVTGITQEALNVFQAHSYKKVSRMGINRGHIHNRAETLKQMLRYPFDNAQDWWDFFWDRDQTILMTSTENMSEKHSHIYKVPEGLFHTSGFAWRHGKNEVEFLQDLYESTV